MLNGEYLLIKAGYLKEYATKRYSVQKNIESVDYRDFAANRFEQALASARNIYSFDGANATIRIEGPLSVDGPDIWDLFSGIGGCSYLDIQDAIAKATADVDAGAGEVVIQMNTPGGTVDGCDATFQVMWKLSQTHEVVVHNMGLVASAGEWLASAATQIVAKTPVALQGSIGVVLNTFDFTGMLEAIGIEEIIITNFESPDKIPDLKTEKGKEVVREELDAIFGVFASRVLQGRDRALGKGVMTIQHINDFKGRVLIAEKAVEVGLSDALEDSSSIISSEGVRGEVVISKEDGTEGQTHIDKNKLKIEKEGENREIKKAKGGKGMDDLTKLLDENPGAKAQYVEAIGVAREEGVQSVRAVIDKVLPIMQSDNYVNLKSLAGNVLKGEADVAALVAATASTDALREEIKSLKTQTESGEQPETKPEGSTGVESKGGKIETAEDYGAGVAALRQAQGLPAEATGGAS